MMGATYAALKYCTQALELAQKNFGSLHHYLCLAHRAHLLCELKRNAEALLDFECASAAHSADAGRGASTETCKEKKDFLKKSREGGKDDEPAIKIKPSKAGEVVI